MSEFKNLDVLADQLYQEGLEKAHKASDKLLADAEKKAQQTIDEANKEAELIISRAKKAAEKHRATVDSEVNHKGKQAKQDLQRHIERLITAKLLAPHTKEVLSDKDFVKQLIISSLEAWKDDKELELSIPASLKALKSDLNAKVHKVLPGLKITPIEHLDCGFIIENKNKGYILSFTESDFEALFEPYLTSSVAAILFTKDE